MAFFVPGDGPINSTQGTATDPSTSALIAQLDSTQLYSSNRGGIYHVSAWPGGSTNGVFVLEHVTSTGLTSTSIVESHTLRTFAGVTPQYVRKFQLEKGHFLRVRMSTTFTGDFECKLQAERLE